MHISLAIIFATQEFAPPDSHGITGQTVYPLPVFSFALSVIGSALGMTKFLLNGPLPILPKQSLLNGMLSMPFFLAFILNLMFAIRVFAIENIFFSSYYSVNHPYNITNLKKEMPPLGYFKAYEEIANGKFTTTIDPIFSPEYRLLLYFLPSLISLLANVIKLKLTVKEFGMFFLRYPQFVISPCFSPFMYIGNQEDSLEKGNGIKIWKLGSVLNAVFIGVVPLLALVISHLSRGITAWNFHQTTVETHIIQQNTALFKSPYGNISFSTLLLVFFSIVILLFFFNEKIFSARGVHCRVFDILCCPCPDPCLITEPISERDTPLSNTVDQIESSNSITMRSSKAVSESTFNKEIARDQNSIDLYKNGGDVKTWLIGTNNGQHENISMQVRWVN